METLLPVGLIIAGVVLGAFVFSRVGHWLVGINAVVKRGRNADCKVSVGALLTAVLLASGPWVLLAVTILGFNTIDQVWAQWLFAGAAAAILGFGVLTIYLARKAASKGKHAA